MRWLPGVLLVISVGTIVAPAFAEKKKPTAEQRAHNCNFRNITCQKDCDLLIDIGTAVRDCKNRCEVRHARCMLKSGVLKMAPGQPTQNNLDSLETKD